MARKREGRKALPPKPVDQTISLKTAVDLTSRYRRSAPASEKGGFFFLTGVRKLLGQPDVYGLRFYHGLDAKGNYRLVLVGVDKNGEDIVKTARPRTAPKKAATTSQVVALSVQATSGDAVLLDGHFPCPPWCPPNSPLA
jgi:hypothetical protein